MSTTLSRPPQTESSIRKVAILFAGANGYLDKWSEATVADYEKQMLEFMESKYSEVLKDIKEAGDISEETDGKLKKALDEFQEMFQAAE